MCARRQEAWGQGGVREDCFKDENEIGRICSLRMGTEQGGNEFWAERSILEAWAWKTQDC